MHNTNNNKMDNKQPIDQFLSNEFYKQTILHFPDSITLSTVGDDDSIQVLLSNTENDKKLGIHLFSADVDTEEASVETISLSPKQARILRDYINQYLED